MNPERANTGPKFAAVIVNYNGGSMLSECVCSCLREGIPPAQIIVVDNGSRDGSIEELSSEIAGLTLVRNSCNAGFARAVNQGIRQTKVEFILLLNNDARLGEGTLSAFAEGFDQQPNLAIAGARLLHPDGRLQSSFAPLPSVAEELFPPPLLRLFAPERFRRKTARTEPLAVESVFGACLSIRAEILPRLGLLDEDFFFFFEEVEWCQRARNMGFEVVFLPAARVVHGWGVTANRFRGPARVEYQRSKLTFFRKTRSRSSWCVVSSFLVVRTLVDALAGTVSCLATLFLNGRLRKKTATYWYLVLWHILLRPAHWGLPDKCPRCGDDQG
jgi:N-acetylglucosaminyl-diphospho-decaprenol L-rhamnosyltransferase